jgi:uncharacterized protein (TIGR03000 family)
MSNDAEAMRRSWEKVGAGALVLLSLTGIGLPRGRAQYDYQGGFVNTHRDPSDVVSPSPPPYTPSPDSRRPPTYSPDHDFYYRPYAPATTPIIRSYYYSAGVGERPTAPPTGALPYALSSAALPWNQPDFKGYDESSPMAENGSLPAPRKYALQATPLPGEPVGEKLDGALLIAHVPEDARLWFDGRSTRSRGQTRYFRSPPLTPGEKYSYRVGVAWLEDGQWVGQTLKVPVQAGSIQAIFLRSTYLRPVSGEPRQSDRGARRGVRPPAETEEAASRRAPDILLPGRREQYPLINLTDL